jgi:hypothetical protein
MTALVDKPIAFAAVVLMLASPAVAQWSEPSAEDIIVRGGWLFDGVSNTRRQNTGIVIRDGKFAEVDADLQEQVLAAANVIDLTDLQRHHFSCEWRDLDLVSG